MKLGMVGLPNVGKSTLFNALSQGGAEAANYPFCTIEPNVGVVTVPDSRLDTLAKLYNPDKVIPAYIEFVDIAGLVKGASKGEGLGNQFLSHIREVDAIIHVVRCFSDENVVHVDGSVDPLRDIETINIELMLSDLDAVDKRLAKTIKGARVDKTLQGELKLLERLKVLLEDGKLASAIRQELSEDDELILKSFNLLTYKPVIYAANVAEEDLVNDGVNNNYVNLLNKFAKDNGSLVFVVCAKIEEEISELSAEEKLMFLSDLGVDKSGLDRIVAASYEILGLISYLTAGEKEVRAWTIINGTKAPGAAGKIHSDFERGFIRAEIVSYNDLISAGDMVVAKKNGQVRSEGKEYVVKDGDVILFRFNV